MCPTFNIIPFRPASENQQKQSNPLLPLYLLHLPSVLFLQLFPHYSTFIPNNHREEYIAALIFISWHYSQLKNYMNNHDMVSTTSKDLIAARRSPINLFSPFIHSFFHAHSEKNFTPRTFNELNEHQLPVPNSHCIYRYTDRPNSYMLLTHLRSILRSYQT